MQIKVPKTIQVGGHVYSVIFNDDDVNDAGNSAMVNHRTQTIELDSREATSRKRRGLIHEITHIINYVYLDGVLREHEVAGIAEGFVQVFPQLGIELDWGEIESV